MLQPKFARPVYLVLIYSLIAGLLGAILVFTRGPSELMILLTGLIFLASLYYPRRIYLPMIAILALTAGWVSYTSGGRFGTPPGTILVLFIVTVAVTEFIHRLIKARSEAAEALQASEEYFRSMFAQSPIGIELYDASGRLVDANSAALALMGVSDLARRKGTDLFTSSFVPEPAKVTLRNGKTASFEVELDFDHIKQLGLYEANRTGHAYLGVMIRPLSAGQGGSLSGYLAQLVDITQRKRTEAQRRHAQKMEAISQLAGGIAHEFNNLLTVINSRCAFALEALDPQNPISQDLAKALAASRRAAELTRQLLAFGRGQEMRMQVCNLNSTLEELAVMLRCLMGESITVAFSLAPGLGSIQADPSQVEHIVLNLATNARDAMPDGGVFKLETANVELDAEAASTLQVQPGSYAMLSLSDTGYGMASEVHAHLFEPFFTTKEVGKGTGLGLATVYGIVKQSGGGISVHSKPEQGTTFSVYLPRTEVVVEKIDSKPKATGVPRGTEAILVVEDEDEVRGTILRMLQRLGYATLEASGAAEALKIFAAQGERIRLVLSDVVMPEVNGPELVARLRQLKADFAVLYTSGYSSDLLLQHGSPEVEMNLLPKPFTMDALASRVRQALDREGASA